MKVVTSKDECKQVLTCDCNECLDAVTECVYNLIIVTRYQVLRGENLLKL